MLEKTFDPKSAEPRLYQRWENSGAFRPERVLERDPAAKPFSMVIPPPNVTGSLHIGHALNNTLQDVLARFHRMRGEAVLWLPGTDHAGIATQMVVERQLAAAGNIGRREMGREAFVERVWEWKAESGGTITRQLRRMGASCDWSRERFTLDEGLSAAVRKVFVALHKQGLIYRDKRLVNWDPQFQTAISDLEVEQREVDGSYWRFAYPLADGSGEIVVATTRPETMLGDTAVAVHPDDERYTHLVGRQVRLPIADRLIPIVADAYADPEKGSGAVKITPAHDFNDFQVGKRHDLPLINILTDEAKLNDEVPPEFRGMDRFAARKAVIARMEELGLLRGIDPTRHVVPHGDRSGVVIEPYLTDQWYVDAKTLAQPAIKAVERGDMVFEPKNWDRTYFEWMRNIEPWCVSRQLWWGHRIPAWFAEDGEIFVEETEREALAAALHFMDDVPFKRVFINALVRDDKGQKMSKSKGNVIDPLELVDEYGADALRFTLTAMSGQARDIKLAKGRVEGYRNFGTKLWNAARFCQMNECTPAPGFDPAGVNQVVNKWIRGEVAKTTEAVTRALTDCAFDEAASALYRFIWNVFCDWYLELAKPILSGDDEAAKAETRATAAWALDQALKLLHPVSPFLTEELWDKTAEFGPKRSGLLMEEAWPEPQPGWVDPAAEAEIGWVIDLVSEVRSIRAEMNVPPSARTPLFLIGAGPATRQRLIRNRDRLCTLARLDSVREAETAPAGAAQFAVGDAVGALSIAEFIDLAAERTRLAKAVAALDGDIARVLKKLENPDFMAKAREDVIAENRTKLADAEADKVKIEAALARLASVG
ncbi:MAG: valine--tRNA ligase [Caulobacterales bacterium 32-69-10]|nr:MAG: valine--tRNA ligase [Caulobacterales bacterium 32-69-10]